MAAVPLRLPSRPTPSVYTDGEPFLSNPQASVMAQMHPRTLYRKIQAGEIPCYGRIHNYRVKLSDILPIAPEDPAKERRTVEMKRRSAIAKSRRLSRHPETSARATSPSAS